jgi:uncharacterized LabA/DUF88 family protein
VDRCAIFIDGAYVDKLFQNHLGGVRVDHVDILLGVDMVELAATRQINRAVLVAGDSDFLPAIEVVKRQGVLTVLWHGPRGAHGRPSTCHNDLWEVCDERFEIDGSVARAVAR